jgi:hypothetical protein
MDNDTKKMEKIFVAERMVKVSAVKKVAKIFAVEMMAKDFAAKKMAKIFVVEGGRNVFVAAKMGNVCVVERMAVMFDVMKMGKIFAFAFQLAGVARGEQQTPHQNQRTRRFFAHLPQHPVQIRCG